MLRGSFGTPRRAVAGALSMHVAPRLVSWRSEAFAEGDRHFGGGVIDANGVGPLGDGGRPNAVAVRPRT